MNLSYFHISLKHNYLKEKQRNLKEIGVSIKTELTSSAGRT